VPVLVVDDNPTSRKVLSETLTSFGFRVTVAASGAEALDRLETADPATPFQLVLMDWKMPGMDGIETSRRIKGHGTLKQAPTIIMVTAHGREEVMKEASRSGLDGFLIKPVSPSVLFNTLIAALGGDAETQPEPPPETVVPGEIAARIRGAHVLVVEDNEINQQVAREILENAGLRVSVADNGQMALEKLEHSLFHAVLMDIQMPVMDGFAAADAIRNSPLLKSIPVIAMTAHAMTGDREKGLAAGMNDYVTKPIDPENLIRVLAKWIRIEHRPGKGTGRRIARPEPPVALPGALDGIDMERGLVRMGGNRQLFRNLLVRFRTDYAGAGLELTNLINAGRLEDARRLAHSIKGVAGNLGAEDLSDAAGHLEVAIVQDGADTSPRAIDTFTRELERMVTALQAVEAPSGAVHRAVRTAAWDASGTAPVTPEHLSVLLALKPHVKARRPKPCAAGLERITRLTWPEDLAPEVDQLVKKIQKYRYKDALEILDRLKERLAQ
jgi:CheY-like chemotaxis protein/HPt (histidine-containing phosphotransfer) domain-containing protein